ncbi:MAG: helicase-related protein [Sphingomonadales bacterium]
MSAFQRPALTAVLGPTNTGKTHLAIERMCGHSSGIMGFPLRLLAREVYDRVVAIKGAAQVALLTGEEKILPPGARWLLCTAESMPVDREAAFVALDEAQLGADPERGHVFTDRLLRARGREATMILGASMLAPMVRALLPEAEIVKRPRFSTLAYAGAKKLSRIPKRSAIVAFSAEEVYAVAEMLRRTRGGAAVVMGALSPRTRNAQVAMYQAGEVDYLVATDAIGMGLNMDIGHVAFASLTKFDGYRQRRLTVAEMAQIAGRAGRHQRDGTFGSLGSEVGPAAFRPEEIEAIEEHRFQKLEHLYWREGSPDMSSLDALIDSLETPPAHERLRAAPQALDLAVLKRLADDPEVRGRTRHPFMVARLWTACGVPDFRKVGADYHARLVSRLFRHLSEGDGHVPVPWFADELQRLDKADGDVETLGGRIAGVRTWAYIAQRADWLADPAHWAARTQAVEERLSDALHARLTERFVDRRTSVLMRQVGGDIALLDVAVGDDGVVTVEDEPLGRIDGFKFAVDPSARGVDRKRLLAAAERYLVRERARRAAELVAAPDGAFHLDGTRSPLVLQWAGHDVATLAQGRALTPDIRLDRSLDALEAPDRTKVALRLKTWLDEQLARYLGPLRDMEAARASPKTPAATRAILAPLIGGGGIVPRVAVESALGGLGSDLRRALTRSGLTIGTLDVYDARLLKPGALFWANALDAVRAGTAVAATLRPGATVGQGTSARGYRCFGDMLVRIDLIERIARATHDLRTARQDFVPDTALATSFGVDATAFAHILRALGFRPGTEGKWRWGQRTKGVTQAPGKPSGAFAALGALRVD